MKFSQFKTIYAAKGLTVNNKTFEKNIGLFSSNKKYNLMAELLADKNDISIKVVTFAGKDKTVMLKRTEYGMKCLISAVDDVLEYMNVINET